MTALALETVLQDLRKSQLWHETTIVREALEGNVDGVNVVFRLPLAPALQSEGLTVYASSGSTIPSADYTVESWDAGVVVMDDPPVYPLYGSYVSSELSQTQGLNIVKRGWDLVQSKYHRSYYLVASGGSTYISDSSSSANDPSVGDTTFSGSRRQRYALLIACEIALAQAKMRQEAFHGGFMYREGLTGGVQVDRRQSVDNLIQFIDQAERALNYALDVALQEEGLEVAFGSYLSGATSATQGIQGTSTTPSDLYRWWEESDQGRGFRD